MLTPDQRTQLQTRLTELNYELLEKPDMLFVRGKAGTDREGETFWYKFADWPYSQDLVDRIIWERSWNGYEPVEDYIARNPVPVIHG